MTQKEYDFIVEACQEKLNRLLTVVANDANELLELREYKKKHEQEDKPKAKSTENVEIVVDKPKAKK